MNVEQLVLFAILSGFVVDASTKEPIPGAAVAIPFVTEEIRTDAAGHFSFRVEPGRYDVYASAPGYEDLRLLRIPVTDGGMSDLRIELKRAAGDSVGAVYRVGDVAVTASRQQSRVLETPREVLAAGAARIRDRLVADTPDALSEMPQVQVQKTSLGGGSPIIRGLSGNRILLLVDGVRLNNSTYRLGLNQYLNTVDPGMVEAIEVVPGAGSALYGSDALGGVIQVITAKPSREDPLLAYAGQVAAAEGSHTHSLRASRWWGSGGALASFGYRDLQDIRGGGGVGTQKPTGYSEWSGAGRILLRPKDGADLTLSLQTTRQNEVPRIDRIAAGKDSLWLYDPQDRNLLLARFDGRRPVPFMESLSLAVSWHRQKEGRRVISNGNKDTLSVESDDVSAVGFTLEARSLLSGTTFATYGADVTHDAVDSDGRIENLATGATAPAPGKFPDDGEQTSIGAFLQTEHALAASAKLVAALRLSSFHLTGTPRGPFGRVALDNTVVTGALLIRLGAGAGTHLFGGISQSFRAPNMEDALSTGLSNKGYDVPNPDLGPERGWNLEAGLKSEGLLGRDAEYNASATAYVTIFEDFMERAPATFLGSDSLQGQPVFRNENLGNALITGVSGQAGVRRGVWTARASAAWTYGENTDADAPLTRIPPIRGNLSLRRSWSGAWIEGAAEWAARQDRLSPDDLLDTRIPSDGTPAYLVGHLRAGVALNPDFKLRLVLENLADTAYKDHGSGIYGSGRNLIAGVEWTSP